jgi:hypothetical protein
LKKLIRKESALFLWYAQPASVNLNGLTSSILIHYIPGQDRKNVALHAVRMMPENPLQNGQRDQRHQRVRTGRKVKAFLLRRRIPRVVWSSHIGETSHNWYEASGRHCGFNRAPDRPLGIFVAQSCPWTRRELWMLQSEQRREIRPAVAYPA